MSVTFGQTNSTERNHTKLIKKKKKTLQIHCDQIVNTLGKIQIARREKLYLEMKTTFVLMQVFF